ncbi:MAG: hypothetical protein RBS99_00060 [Rhodospirillales bacterium]|jgi:uracil-DNA glycosylase|nr:hypothetical protein [Rhodospirillales bacterium]
MHAKLEGVQAEIYDFLESANAQLPGKDALYYGGQFLTGCLDRPDFLFAGINPGFGADDWIGRPKTFQRRPFEAAPCKFISEQEEGAPLASDIVGVLLNDDASRLARCAETSLVSVFATPGVPDLNRQLAATGLQQRHGQLMKHAVEAILEALRPKQVVCIGMTAHKAFTGTFGISQNQIAMKSVKSASGLSDPVYYKCSEFNGIPVHGVLIHRTAHPSRVMLDELRQIFKEL